MQKHVILIFLIFFISCSPKLMNKTDKKKIYTSNENIFYDANIKKFKYEFSINNLTNKTLTNFAYSIVFKNSGNVAIDTLNEYFDGSIEPGKASRASVYIGDFIRKNFKSTDIFIKN